MSYVASKGIFVKPTLLALAAAAVCAHASAQNAAPASTLSEVVVSASGFEQELKQAPASISVVTREELEKKSFRDLAEALQGIEGIDVKGGTGKTGGFNISMRGMPSDYTLVLIDGRRPNPAGDTTPNGFSEALTSLIPPMSAIERIEVIRGPMSTLYGSDAMGGVINIITRKVAKEWGGSVQLEGSLPENGDQGAVQKTSFYLNGPIQQDKLGLALRGSLQNRDRSSLVPSSGDGTISNRGPNPAKSDQQSFGARLTLTPAAGQEVWMDIDSARSEYENGQCELGPRDGFNRSTCKPVTTNIALGYTDALNFNRDQYAIGYKGKLSIGLLETSLSHTTNETKGRTIATEVFATGSTDPRIGTARLLESTSTIWDTKLVNPVAENHLLTLGTQYAHTVAKDGIAMIAGSNSFKQDTWAVFAEDEWSINEALTATGGLRYDHHDKFGGHWSPRAYLVWNSNDFVTLKGGISRGFRAPKVNQMVDGLNGMTGGGTTNTIGNPDLKPETSTSTEFGVLLDNQSGWTGSATAFHNKIKNKILGTGINCGNTTIPGCIGMPNNTTFSINSDEGKTYGLELGTKYIINPAWNVAANYTWTESEQTSRGKTTALSDVAKHVASATLNWNINNQWSTWLQAEYRGKSRRFNAAHGDLTGDELLEYKAIGDIKGYALLNLGTQYRVNKNVTLSGSIHNLFDKDFLQFKQWTNGSGEAQWANSYVKSGQSTKGSIPDGRTLWLKANVQF